ncbi:hypothetical protein EDD15DRAFT_2133459, partial [Pisolithus albus]
DRTLNEACPIHSTMNLCLSISDHSKIFACAVTNMGKSSLIVGFDWLQKHNPLVDWCKGKKKF